MPIFGDGQRPFLEIFVDLKYVLPVLRGYFSEAYQFDVSSQSDSKVLDNGFPYSNTSNFMAGFNLRSKVTLCIQPFS